MPYNILYLVHISWKDLAQGRCLAFGSETGRVNVLGIRPADGLSER